MPAFIFYHIFLNFMPVSLICMKLMHRKLRYDSNRSFDFIHLCYYLSKNEVKDDDQRRIIDFKQEDEQAVRYFIIEAINNLRFFDFTTDHFIVRALSSNELKANFNGNIGLERLGACLADVFDCTYYPSIIYKTKQTLPIKSLSAADRKQALSGVYAVDTKMFDLNSRKLIIIDDVVTTGATSCAIIEAVLTAYPKADITIFSLAWTPTAKQQDQLRQIGERSMSVNEPDVAYGSRRAEEWVDEDFLNGETFISL